MLSMRDRHGLKNPLSRGSRRGKGTNYLDGSRNKVSILGVRDVPAVV